MKLVSINIEGDKHLDKVRDFLFNQLPDVVCLSEVFEEDAKELGYSLGLMCVFAHQSYRPSFFGRGNCLKTFGIALLAKQIANHQIKYLSGDSNTIPRFEKSIDLTRFSNRGSVPVISAHVIKGNKDYHIINTHLTVTKEGSSTNYQNEQAQNLLAYLDSFLDIVLCGDFNAPRGGEVFSLFAAKYKDNIPVKYLTSLDQSLHRIPGLRFVVDCLFSTKKYKITDVILKDGVSDHMAVVANIRRKNKLLSYFGFSC